MGPVRPLFRLLVFRFCFMLSSVPRQKLQKKRKIEVNSELILGLIFIISYFLIKPQKFKKHFRYYLE